MFCGYHYNQGPAYVQLSFLLSSLHYASYLAGKSNPWLILSLYIIHIKLCFKIVSIQSKRVDHQSAKIGGLCLGFFIASSYLYGRIDRGAAYLVASYIPLVLNQNYLLKVVQSNQMRAQIQKYLGKVFYFPGLCCVAHLTVGIETAVDAIYPFLAPYLLGPVMAVKSFF